jgi:hypothetical protein
VPEATPAPYVEAWSSKQREVAGTRSSAGSGAAAGPTAIEGHSEGLVAKQ